MVGRFRMLIKGFVIGGVGSVQCNVSRSFVVYGGSDNLLP